MSNALLPSFPGRAWPIKFSPGFNTKILPAVSGKETRAAFQLTPIWTITLPFDYLSQADYLSLSGFFMTVRGRWDSFLLNADLDSVALDMSFGAGNGSTTAFQLSRTMGGFVEAVQNVGGVSAIKAAGSVVSGSGYSVGATGIVTFNSAPANGAALTWSGTYYYRCRFEQDVADFEEFMSRFYNLKSLKFKGSPSNKLL